MVDRTSFTSNVGFTDYGVEQQALARRQKLAEILLQQGLSPLGPTEHIGNWAIRRSPWEGAAKIAQAAAGAYGIHQSEEKQKELAQKYNTALAHAMQTGEGTPATPAQAPTTAVDDEGNPMPGVAAQPAVAGDRQAMIRQLMQLPGAGQTMALKQMEPYSLAPGAQRFTGGTNQPIATAPNRPLQDNRPEVIRLQEQLGTMLPTDPAYEQIQARIKHLTNIPSQDKGNWGEPYQVGGAWVQKNDATGQVRQAVAREPQVHVYSPPAVTTSRVQDPSNPNQQLEVDARIYRGGSLGAPGVIGVSGKLGDTAKMEAKRQFNMQGIGATLQKADDLLSGAAGKPLPTGSGVGSAYDYAASIVGMAPSGAAEADQLRSVGASLVAKMPRMEGPQSDKDVMLYKEAAGRIGDSTLPISRRKAALETVKELWSKYEQLNPEAFADRREFGTPPPGAVRPR